MPEAGTWTPRKRPLRKPSMQRQKRCYNRPLVPARWTQDVPEGTGPQRRRTPEGLRPLTPLPLIYLVASTSNFPPIRARLARKTRTREVLGAKVAEGVAVMTPPQQVSTPLSRRGKTRKTCPRSPATIAMRKVTTRQSVLSYGRTKTPPKTRQPLRWWTNVDGAPEATLEWVPCSWYPVRFRKDDCRFRTAKTVTIVMTKSFARLG